MSDHPLAGPFYTAPRQAKSCEVCHRGESAMRALHEDRAECSHIDCPHRRRVTAQPSNFKEQGNG